MPTILTTDQARAIVNGLQALTAHLGPGDHACCIDLFSGDATITAMWNNGLTPEVCIDTYAGNGGATDHEEHDNIEAMADAYGLAVATKPKAD